MHDSRPTPTVVTPRGRLAIALVLSPVLVGCGASSVQIPPQPREPFTFAVPLGLDAFAAVPEENVPTPEKIELGRRLFFDPVLSLDGSRSCASCHRPELSFADSVPVSPGVHGRLTTRNASTLVNRAYGSTFFWDGRAISLEEAVLMPISHPDELALPLPQLVRRLQNDRQYRRLFRETFTTEVLSQEHVAHALAHFVRTLRSGDAPLDRYLLGEQTALDNAELRGRALFLGKAGCADCHSGPNFTDERFHNTGVAGPAGDPGRFAVTGEEGDRGRFKTPTLREVARTAPYMHDGSIPSLEEVIDFYDRGGGEDPNLSPDIPPLRLGSGEKADLLAFLRALAPAGDRE
jgi:cytochrome c peroxidase